MDGSIANTVNRRRGSLVSPVTTSFTVDSHHTGLQASEIFSGVLQSFMATNWVLCLRATSYTL